MDADGGVGATAGPSQLQAGASSGLRKRQCAADATGGGRGVKPTRGGGAGCFTGGAVYSDDEDGKTQAEDEGDRVEEESEEGEIEELK